jgi:hypothetical protein
LIEVGYPVVLAALATLTAVLVFKRLLPGFGNRAAAGLVFACLAQAALLMPLIGTRAVDLIGNNDYDELRPGEGFILPTDEAERWFSFEQSWLNPNQIAPILLAASLVTILVRIASNVADCPELKNSTASSD